MLSLWLPLNGNTTQQGISGSTVSNVTATVDNSGKIGKCYSFSGSQHVAIPEVIIPSNTTAWSFACWFYLANTTSSSAACLFSERTGGNAAGYTIFIYPNNSSMLVDDGARWQVTPMTFTAQIWYHLVVTRDSTGKKIYINGELKSSTTTIGTTTSINSNGCLIGKAQNSTALTSGDQGFIGKLNDVRVYVDHTLSPKEVEILSRGLVCHYPLSDRSNQTPNNVFTDSTFTSSSGWGFWGQSGHSGTWNFTQNKDYIFNKTQTNACVISNGASATGDYLMYQSPAFSGGFRSLQAIIKEENSGAITDSIAYPVWNASAFGSTPLNHWTSINDLGNGFYLCRCESIKQDGSNNLVGIYVKPGYKIYVSECYCENDRTVCSDFFYPSTTVYDTSGYQNNGTVSGSLTASSDTARYSVSTTFNGTNTYIEADPLPAETKTISVWIKTTWTSSSSYNVIIHDKNTGFAIGWAGASLITYAGTSNGGSGSVIATSGIWTANKWHNVVVIKTGDKTRDVYIDSVKMTPSSGNYWGADLNKLDIGTRHYSGSYSGYFDGQLSDFRAYATALSAAQVAELYNTAVSVANNGALMGYELVEG